MGSRRADSSLSLEGSELETAMLGAANECDGGVRAGRWQRVQGTECHESRGRSDLAGCAGSAPRGASRCGGRMPLTVHDRAQSGLLRVRRPAWMGLPVAVQRRNFRHRWRPVGIDIQTPVPYGEGLSGRPLIFGPDWTRSQVGTTQTSSLPDGGGCSFRRRLMRDGEGTVGILPR